MGSEFRVGVEDLIFFTAFGFLVYGLQFPQPRRTQDRPNPTALESLNPKP